MANKYGHKHGTAPPWPLLGSSVGVAHPSLVVLLHVVGEGVNATLVAEDVGEVRVDVEVGECDELASNPKHLPEEVVSVEAVGEVDVEADDETVVVELLDPEHARGALGKVAVARREEVVRPIPCAPPPREGPDAELVLNEDTGRVLPLGGGGRALEGRSVELHGG